MKYLKIATALLAGFASVSCLERGLEDLETYTGNDIESIPGIYFRYYSDETNPASGEQVIKQAALSVSNTEIDPEAGTIECTVSIPSGFPQDQRYNVSFGYKPGDRQSVIVTLRISTAATIKPLGDAPELGTPGDWSKPNRYLVTAADGSTKEWTVSLKQPGDLSYTIDDKMADDWYGFAFWNESGKQWRFGYRYENVAFLYLTFKSMTGGKEVPPTATLTTDNVLSAMWSGSQFKLTECNLTITPDPEGWFEDAGDLLCMYKMVGTVKGQLNSLQSLQVDFTADGKTMDDAYPGWIVYDEE